MNESLRSALLAATAAALLVTAASQSLAAAGYAEASRPGMHQQAGRLAHFDSRRIPPYYSQLLPALGRSVYEDLQHAQRAAHNRESARLRVAIQHARETLHRLQRSAAARRLETQLQAFRTGYTAAGMNRYQELWVPVGAGIDTAPGSAPEGVQAPVREDQADVVAAIRQSSLGIFPLHRVMADLDAAQASANLLRPDWAGALEAVHSALATVHWFGRVPARSLLSASDDVVSAYVLATGPVIRDDQRWQILEYLDRAQRALASTPDGRMLAGKARALVDKGEPKRSGISSLLDDIQSLIRSELQHADAGYRKTAAPVARE